MLEKRVEDFAFQAVPRTAETKPERRHDSLPLSDWMAAVLKRKKDRDSVFSLDRMAAGVR